MEIISKDMRQRLIASFMAEQQGLIDDIARGLQLLEREGSDRTGQGPEPAGQNKRSQPILSEIHRQAHTLKGAAQAIGMTDIATLCRTMEQLLFYAKEDRVALTPALFEKLHQTLEAVKLAVLQMQRSPSSDEECQTF